MSFFFFFFFNDTATTEIYTLSLHDALPISPRGAATAGRHVDPPLRPPSPDPQLRAGAHLLRSVESELDGLQRPVCHGRLDPVSRRRGQLPRQLGHRRTSDSMGRRVAPKIGRAHV